MRLFILSILVLIVAVANSQTFTEVDKVSASDRDNTDRFGFDVQMDGEFAIVGAYADDFGALNPNMGSAYIYREVSVGEWIETQKIIASDQRDYDRFGTSVAISGSYAVVGSPQNDYDENDANYIDNAGAAYVFEKDGSGNWIEVQKIVASDRGLEDEFGWSIAIHGNTLVVGAHQENEDENGLNTIYHTGSVYIFERDGGGTWNQTQKIVASDRAPDINYPNGYSGEDVADQFGDAVDIWGGYIVVGAFHHDYDNTGNGTGALWSSGAAYLFEKDGGGVWNEAAIIQNSDREQWDRFGCSVSIDSNIAVVGAYSEDELADGVSGALTNPGSAYVFERDAGGNWMQVQKLVPNDRNSGDHFAYDVEINGDYIVFGCHSDDHDENDANLASNSGSAYVFEFDGSAWIQHQKVDASDRAVDDEHGIAVGLSGDTFIVGAFQQDLDSAGTNSITDAGAAYFYSNDVCLTPISHSQSIDLCHGESLTIGNSTYTSAGTYVDTLLSSQGCDSVLTTSISVYAALDTVITIGAYELSSSASGVSFQWLDCDNGNTAIVGENSNTLDNVLGGNYALEVSDANCADTSICANISCLDGSYAQSESICFGEDYVIGGSSYNTSGVYIDTLLSTQGCDSIIETTLSVAPAINVGVTQNNNVLTADESAASAYQWYDCLNNIILSGETTSTFQSSSVGEFAVIVTLNACSDTSSCSLIDVFNGLSENEIGFDMYPNPASNRLNIKHDYTGQISLEIIDMTGQLIYKSTYSAQTIVLNTSDFASGMYLVKLSSASELNVQACIFK